MSVGELARQTSAAEQEGENRSQIHSSPPPSSGPETASDRRFHAPPQPRSGDDRDPVNLAWFQRGISERNCALFEASLYAVRPELWARTEHWLAQNRPASPCVSDPLQLHLLVDTLILVAFGQSRRWHPEIPIVDWISGFLGDAYAAVEADENRRDWARTVPHK